MLYFFHIFHSGWHTNDGSISQWIWFCASEKKKMINEKKSSLNQVLPAVVNVIEFLHFFNDVVL